MHTENLTQFPLEMVALFLSNNTSLPQKPLPVPSCTNYLPSSCHFYYSDLSNLKSSKWVMILWKNTALGMDGCVQVPVRGWIQEWVSIQLCF